jgi:hypothetical protein
MDFLDDALLQESPTMNSAISKFLDAHARYESLEQVRTDEFNATEREQIHIAIMKAYLEVQYRARVIAGLQFADGMQFAEAN